MHVKVKKVSYYTDQLGNISSVLHLTKKHTYKLENQDFELDSVVMPYAQVLGNKIAKNTVLDIVPEVNKDKQVVLDIKKVKDGGKFTPARKCHCGGDILAYKEEHGLKIFCSNLLCCFRYSTPILAIFKKALGNEEFVNNAINLQRYLQQFPTNNGFAEVQNYMAFIVLFKQVGKKDTNARFEILKKEIPGLEDFFFELENKVDKYLKNQIKKDFWEIANLPHIGKDELKTLKNKFKWQDILKGIDYKKLPWRKGTKKYKAIVNNYSALQKIAKEIKKYGEV